MCHREVQKMRNACKRQCSYVSLFISLTLSNPDTTIRKAVQQIVTAFTSRDGRDVEITLLPSNTLRSTECLWSGETANSNVLLRARDYVPHALMLHVRVPQVDAGWYCTSSSIVIGVGYGRMG